MKIELIISNTEKTNDCLLWKGNVMTCGYGRVYLEGKYWRTHRLFYTIYKGEIPKGLFVCHTCDTPLCCNPDHLFLGTPKENHHDAMKKGRNTRGVMINSCKLTESIVLQIRDRWIDEGCKYGSYSRFAREYGVTEANIRCIVRRETWKHI